MISAMSVNILLVSCNHSFSMFFDLLMKLLVILGPWVGKLAFGIKNINKIHCQVRNLRVDFSVVLLGMLLIANSTCGRNKSHCFGCSWTNTWACFRLICWSLLYFCLSICLVMVGTCEVQCCVESLSQFFP